jgi:hypothetical protein
MSNQTKVCLIAMFSILLSLAAPAADRHERRIIWVDSDTENIAEPSERHISFAENVTKAEFIEQGKRALDLFRWARFAAGRPKAAANVNELDEVPSSSWYTNRLHLHGMTLDELARGPNMSEAPDLTDAVITKAKLEGVTPGFQVKDKKGDSYLLKFDPNGYPELQSGAEVISTKILYAAGYNVPENYVAAFDLEHVRISEETQASRKSKDKHALTRDELAEMLQKAPKMADGRYRVMASKILSGKPKGPFPYIGVRSDDPNDRIPHEHRRELRGLRVIASWINHWDLKEEQTLDMYVEENGRKFLRHYLIDFGSSLGGDKTPLAYFNGREYGLDPETIFKELFTLGIYTAPAEKQGQRVSPAVGAFSANDFKPGEWRPTVPMMPFANMTDADAFWATRVILSFTEPELRRIVETAQYTHPEDSDYMVKTLLERQQIVARYWLPKSDSLTDFSVERGPDGLALAFHDLMIDHRLTDARSIEYQYELRGKDVVSKRQSTHSPSVPLMKLDEPHGTGLDVTIWTVRDSHASPPVTVHVEFSPNGQGRVARISRG